MSKTAYRYIEDPAQAPDSPLFFVFHGTGGDERQFFEFGQSLLPAAHLVSPRGDVDEGGALRFFRRKGQGVYDMDDLAQRSAAMTGFIQDFRADAPARKLIGLGYSNGANILASVMFSQPELFDAAVMMHPLIPFEPRSGMVFDGVRILITAGRQDPICPPDLTEKLTDYFVRHGADVTLDWHEGGHEIRDEEVDSLRKFLTPFR